MDSHGPILVVDDDADARSALTELLRDEGYQVESAADPLEAMPVLEELGPRVVLTNLRMPGMDGVELTRRAHELDDDIQVVVMTAQGSVDAALAAIRQGAADYLTKPFGRDELEHVLERVLERQRLRDEARQLRRRLSEYQRMDNVIGSSASMQKVLDLVMQVASSRASVLITGESGTGKELIAAALHEHSPRAAGPFVKLHCAALAENLLESELFGHERGAFPGAFTRRDGRFQQAAGGTLFLDEIGEISQAVQVKLLRFLQERQLERVGGNQAIKLDVRVIAATNRNLNELVRQGRFREDLFYRLNVVSIEMPSLRERPGDVALLAAHFLTKYSELNGKKLHGFTDAALTQLTRYAWPGNVRELENAVERAVVICRGDQIAVNDLPPAVAQVTTPHDGLPRVPGASLAELERYAILKTLEHTGGSTSRAAEILGISPRKIQYRLHEYRSGDGPRSTVGPPSTDADS